MHSEHQGHTFASSSAEAAAIEARWEKYRSVVPDEINHLPQTIDVFKYLQVGVGVHHGDLLPVLREFVEMLFSAGELYVLFATETCAGYVFAHVSCLLYSSTALRARYEIFFLSSLEKPLVDNCLVP